MGGRRRRRRTRRSTTSATYFKEMVLTQSQSQVTPTVYPQKALIIKQKMSRWTTRMTKKLMEVRMKNFNL